MDSFSDLKDALTNFISNLKQFSYGLSCELKKNPTFSTVILSLKNGKSEVKVNLTAVFLFNKC